MRSQEEPLPLTIVEKLLTRTTYLRASEVMALLQITRATLCDWIRTGELAAYRIGKNNTVDPVDLVTFLEARRTGK
jgi:excisionase family DNA binding protein